MNIIVTGHGMKIGDQLRGLVEKKLAKYDRYFGPDATANVKIRPEAELKRVEITMKVRNSYFRSETEAEDALTALDEGVEVLEGQIRKHKTRLEKRIRDYAVQQEAARTNPLPSLEELGDEPEEEIRIVRRKNFELTPMDPEEACLQMEMLGHSFLLFLHADTGKVALVYRRRDGDYGLIEPTY